MANIQERVDSDGNVTFRVQVRLKGFPPQSASFERVTDARRWAGATEAAIREGRHFKTTEAKRHTFGDMIDRYIKNVIPGKKQNSRHAQTPRLLWWKDRLGDYALADVTPALIAEQRDTLAKETTRLGKKRSPTSVIHFLATLSHVYSIATKEWEWTDSNPLAKVQKPKWPRGRVRFLSDDERARLLTACQKSANTALYDIVVLALSSGMRYSEMLTLTWADVDTNRGMVTLLETKNGERRAVPLVGHARERIQERARIRRLDTPLLFPSPKFGETVKPYDIKSAWHTALADAGIQDFRFHDLRHSAASYLAMNGASLAEIAEVLGHKTLSMVKRYAHLSDAHTSGVVARMNAAIFATPEGNQDHA